MVVQRHHELNEVDGDLMVEGGVDYMNDPEIRIVMAVDEEAVFQIISSGEFLNFHQTKSTNGYAPTVGARKEKEDDWLDLDVGNSVKAQRLRPKSAYLFLGDQFHDLFLGKTNMRSNYGGYFPVFKNEVKQRALWARHDSLAVNTLYSFNIRPAAPLTATPDLHGEYSAYFESLIYGQLTLNDVDHWLIEIDENEIEELDEYAANPNMAIGQLVKMGEKMEIPVYIAEKVIINGRTELKKGPKIELPK